MKSLIGYGFPSPAATFLAPGLGVFLDMAAGWVSSGHEDTGLWTRDVPKFAELDQLLDAVSTGPRWLERLDVAGVVANALWKGVRESRYELGAWVLMPNHVHIALRAVGDQDLASTVKSIKGSSAHAANRLLNRNGSRFWARDYFDRRIRDREHEGRVTRAPGVAGWVHAASSRVLPGARPGPVLHAAAQSGFHWIVFDVLPTLRITCTFMSHAPGKPAQ